MFLFSNKQGRRQGGRGERKQSGPQRCTVLSLEPLESRLAPATLTVNSRGDDVNPNAYFTLREAIEVVNGTLNVNTDLSPQERALIDQSVNALGTNDVIQFNIGLNLD